NLKSYGLDLKTIPWVIQFNKRDLPNALPVEQMSKELNRLNVPTYEAQAANGTGVFETLRGVSKLLLAKISKDVVEKDRGIPTAARGSKAPPADERPGSSVPGRIMQALKRGKSQPEPVEEEAPMLPEDALVEDAPPPSYLERNPFAEASKAPPPPAREEMVLGDQDIVVEREEPEIVRASDDDGIVRSRDEDGILSEGEIERESTYDADRATTSAGGKSIVVPIDLGSLPKSGRLRVTFEFTIDVVDGAPSKTRATKHTHMRDLDPV
ncbi:MAG TPA: hypothetical protein VL503_02690, partial [Candidatus Omnitrophota bacterium]|nr:hypothetical protein [Candidatus Omnitrophota bacterium]